MFLTPFFGKVKKTSVTITRVDFSAIGDGDGALTAPEFLICCERLMGPSKVPRPVVHRGRCGPVTGGFA